MGPDSSVEAAAKKLVLETEADVLKKIREPKSEGGRGDSVILVIKHLKFFKLHWLFLSSKMTSYENYAFMMVDPLSKDLKKEA